jgi:hypothetical protein
MGNTCGKSGVYQAVLDQAQEDQEDQDTTVSNPPPAPAPGISKDQKNADQSIQQRMGKGQFKTLLSRGSTSASATASTSKTVESADNPATIAALTIAEEPRDPSSLKDTLSEEFEMERPKSTSSSATRGTSQTDGSEGAQLSRAGLTIAEALPEPSQAPQHDEQSVCAAYDCRYGHGVLVFNDDDRAELKKILEPLAKEGKIEFEIPATGAALVSRMPAELQKALDAEGFFGARSQQYKDCLRLLVKDAEKHFEAVVLPPRPAIPDFSGTESQKQIIEKMFQASDGLVVAEGHSSIASKKFLIDNMGEFAKQGVKTLYMEHLCSDLHQRSLDRYLQLPPGSPMPEDLKTYLASRDEGFMSFAGEIRKVYNFSQVAVAAQAAGIEIVAIDCDASYNNKAFGPDFYGDRAKEDKKTRMRTMNYLADKRIGNRRDPENPEKWLAFVGSAHANTCLDVPGIAELTGALSIVVDDDKKPEEAALRTKVKQYMGDLDVDAVLTIIPHMDTAAPVTDSASSSAKKSD